MWFCFVWFWPRLLHFSLVFHYLFSSLLSSPLHFSYFLSSVLFTLSFERYCLWLNPTLIVGVFHQIWSTSSKQPSAQRPPQYHLIWVENYSWPASLFFFCCHGKPFHILERRFSFRTLRKIWNLCWKIVSLAVVLVVMRFYFGGWRFFMAIIMQTPCSRSTILIKTICRF